MIPNKETTMNKQFIRDLAERVISTYVQVLLGLVIASSATDAINISTLRAAAVSAIPAALSVLKGLIAKQFGSADDASLIEPGPPYGD